MLGRSTGWLVASCLLTGLADVRAGEGPAARGRDVVVNPTADDPRLPPVPTQVLQGLAKARGAGLGFVFPEGGDIGAVATELGISDEQRQKLAEVVQAHSRWSTAQLKVRQSLDQGFGLNNSPLAIQLAFETLEDRERQRLNARLAGLLTREQRAGLRRRFRKESEIAHLSRSGQFQPAQEEYRIDTRLRQNDELALLNAPQVQTRLDITDDQYLALRDLLDKAVADATRLIELEISLASDEPANGPQGMAPDHVFVEAMRTLTADQQERLKKYLLGLPPNELPRMMAGTVTNIRQVNDDIEVEVRLGNPVENSEELRRAIGITEEQRKQFAAALKTDEEHLKRKLTNEAVKRNLDKKLGTARGTDIRKAFLEEWNAAARAVLTPEQVAKIGTIKWHQRGLMSLIDPEFGKLLELTADQQAAIRKQLVDGRENDRVDNPFPQPGANPAEIQKQMQKRMEQMQARNADMLKRQQAALEVLTPAQREKFIELTGYRPRAAAPPRPMPQRPGVPQST